MALLVMQRINFRVLQKVLIFLKDSNRDLLNIEFKNAKVGGWTVENESFDNEENCLSIYCT